MDFTEKDKKVTRFESCGKVFGNVTGLIINGQKSARKRAQDN